MSTAKHKSFRKVIQIERFEKTEGSLTFPVTIVTWIIVERENSKSYFTRHLGTTVYVGPGSKNSGVQAYMMTKEFRVAKNLKGCEPYESLRDRVTRAYSHAFFSYLGSIGGDRTGKVIWYDETRGDGMLQDSETGINLHFYACNFKDADSVYPERVKNVSVERNMELKFSIHKDPFVSQQCGATNLKVA